MARFLDPHVFRACAWPTGDIPEPGDLVYYFPRGHAEQSESLVNLPDGTPPYFICSVVSVSLLANPTSDEVFARFLLKADQDAVRNDTGAVSDMKVLKTSSVNPLTDTAPAAVTDTDQDVGKDGTGVDTNPSPLRRAEMKLSNSDVETEPYLLVPYQWIQWILPPLKIREKQMILVKDIHGNDFSFKYICSKKFPPHRLTTGWTQFVEEKSLVSGDTLIAIKNRNLNANDQPVFGIRRTTIEDAEENPQCGFSRRSLGRLKALAILKAVSKAQRGEKFKVDYYPRVEFAEFVVKKDVVEEARSIKWKEGMKVKIASYENYSVYRNIGWVSSLLSTASSPWRMLEVSERDTSEKHILSPWQVKVTESPHPMTSEASGRNDTNVSQDRIIQSQISPKMPVLKRKKL